MRGMRPLRALGVYLVAVFIGGALLAPFLWHVAQAGGPLLAKAASKPFQRFVINSFLLVAIAGLWPFFRALGATSRREIGLPSPLNHGASLFKGAALGLLSLLPIVLLVLVSGARGWHDELTVGKVIGKIFGAAFTAIGVALLEEILFRGGVFGGLRRVFDWRFALIGSALVYAAAHFLADTQFEGPVTWYSGLQLLPQMWRGFFHWGTLFPAFFNLTLAGLLLGIAYYRTGTLYFSIGLHAGWIFWLALYRTVTTGNPHTAEWFWGTDKMIDGWLAFLVLAITFAAYARLPVVHRVGDYTLP